MDQMIGLLLFLMILGGVLVILIISNVQRDQLIKNLEKLAVQKGWQFQKKPSSGLDCLMKGQDHIIQWELKYFNKEQLQSGLGKKESVESIVWFCPQVVALDGALVMFPRPTNLPPQTGTSNSGLYGGLALAMANGMLQSAGVDISRSYFQAAGSTDLQSTYMILAPDPASALQLCSAVQDLVQNWPLKRRGLEMPSIVIDSSGTRLRVVCNNISCNNKYVLAEKMVGLGQAIVSAFA